MKTGMLVIPGYKRQIDHYPNLLGALADEGHQVFPLTMDWEAEPGPGNWANQVHKQTDLKEFAVIAGFSYGGATALAVASDYAELKIPIRSLALLSHSSVFEENLDDPRVVRGLHRSFGNVPEGMRELTLRQLVRNIRRLQSLPQVAIVYGRGEIATIKKRARDTVALFGQDPTVLFNARHDLDAPPYVRGAVRAVRL